MKCASPTGDSRINYELAWATKILAPLAGIFVEEIVGGRFPSVSPGLTSLI